ncbi:CcdB family protein [Desulfoluna butyratoxydans]|uniref:Toxin CcdB n=1 Tax=Desulfoluna butyratoxydans TaxID=231438 RepID=A0A4U8YQ92_9BACT|nr:CcdB family protein [Desulfoluna butyratoxydans]VFQ43892.1 plasmid maintenance toxin/cell growth inhibitor [Desulfoluna butyratoxydans]
MPWLDWVVTPISKQSRLITTPIERLPPVLSIENTPHVLLTPQLSAIPASELGDAIIGALDFLCTGYERHVLIPV